MKQVIKNKLKRIINKREKIAFNSIDVLSFDNNRVLYLDKSLKSKKVIQQKLIVSDHELNTQVTLLAKDAPGGVILWRGQSHDKKPIVCIATGLNTHSGNIKTGAMVQTYIIRADVHPQDALWSGDDKSVCYDCKHRPKQGKTKADKKADKNHLGSCYVFVAQGVAKVFEAFKRGNYPDYSDKYRYLLYGRKIRFGSYGDPYAVPIKIWQLLKELSIMHTGYSHQFMQRYYSDSHKGLFMASCDTAKEREIAKSLGNRTFRQGKSIDDIAPDEVLCPASKEGGFRTTCDNCLLCTGNTKKAKDVYIVSHGPRSGNYRKGIDLVPCMISADTFAV